MGSTITRDCKICGIEFDSILQADDGICDNCHQDMASEAREMSKLDAQIESKEIIKD